jgi:crotonobetainyl-CoA:carnitine CoA-transferase CaiB-like acyl-CoA transferase
VLDLTRVLAGPLCTMWLGDMGADVIKVEQPGRGDDTRAWGPPFAGTESAYFLGVNRNKRSIALNLKTDAGRELLGRLARTSDVIIDNFKVGTLARWGFDDAWYEANAPRAVRNTISGYGATGPKAGKPGYDFILQAETGLMAITGEPDGGSMKLGVAIVDICTGMLATISILAALEARHRTGRGQHTEVTLHDTGLQMLANVAANYLISREPPGRYGNGHPNIVPYRTYPTSDGELAIAVGNDDQFVRFAALLGHPEWAEDPRFARNRDRVVNRDVIDRLVGEAIAGSTRAEWIEMLDPEGIACGPINTVAESLSSPQTIAREMVTEVTHPKIGSVPMLGIPFRFDGTPATIRSPAPLAGEHTEEVLTVELGIPADKVAEMRSAGVI